MLNQNINYAIVQQLRTAISKICQMLTEDKNWLTVNSANNIMARVQVYWLEDAAEAGANSSAWSFTSCLLRDVRSVQRRENKLLRRCSNASNITTCKKKESWISIQHYHRLIKLTEKIFNLWKLEPIR